MSEPIKNPLKLFYCYAHEDQALRDALDSHLISLKRQKLIEIWYDGKISAGAEWEKEINKHLSSADIVLLLVSVSFMASDYCYSKEMTRALQRHEEGTACVIPIILRPVDWEDAPFSKLQVLPTEAKPVTRWLTPDDAYEDIAKRLRVVVKELQAARETVGKDVVAPPFSAPQTPSPLQRTKEEWLKEGSALNDLERYEESLLAYEQAIHLDPNDVAAYHGKGSALGNLERYEEAVETFEQAIRLDPNYAFAYYNKGRALYDLERYEEALWAYEQVLHLDPNYADAYGGKGAVLGRLKRYEEALEAFEQELRLDPTYALAAINKGDALNDLGRYEESLLAYEQAIHLDPNSAFAYYNMADTLYRLGRMREAQQARKKARELGYT